MLVRIDDLYLTEKEQRDGSFPGDNFDRLVTRVQ